jgi:hypothetical protein
MPKRFSLEPNKTGPESSPWCVNIPARISESGKRERKFFATKSAAQTYGKSHRIRIENYGTAATLLTPGQLEEATNVFYFLVHSCSRPFPLALGAVRHTASTFRTFVVLRYESPLLYVLQIPKFRKFIGLWVFVCDKPVINDSGPPTGAGFGVCGPPESPRRCRRPKARGI